MTGKILLADDSITIQKVVNLTFADEGIEVVAVSNGEMAERRLSEINPDVVLADIFMPGKNGYELCESIKQHPQYRNLPVVLLVGAFEPFDQAEARRVRADAHLTKPFESRTLVETVRKLMERSGKPRTGSLPSQPLNESDLERRYATNPLPPPPNIDLSAMSQPVTAPAAPAALDPSAPLGIDYTAASDAPPMEVEFETPAGFDSPLPQTNFTSDLSGFGLSDAPADAPPADIAFNTADSASVPSAFGDSAEVSVGFDETDLTAPPAEESVMTFEVSTATEAAPDQTITVSSEPAADYAVEYTEWNSPAENVPVESVPVESAPVETAPAESVQVESAPAESIPVESAPVESAPAAEAASAERSAEPAPGDLLGDDPLGDVLADENYASNVGVPPEDMFELSEPPANMAQEGDPFAAQASAASDEQPVFSVAENLLNETPVDPAAAEAIVADESQTGFAIASEAPQAAEEAAPAAETGAAMYDDTGAADETTFSTSEMWATEETRFTPIDVEAVTLDDSPAPEAPVTTEEAPAAEIAVVETAAVETPAVETLVMEEAPAAENTTGFDFTLVGETPVAEAPIEENPEPIPAPELFAEPAPAEAAPAQSSSESWKEIELSPAVIDEIVRRVVAEISDRVVRDIAWEVVPDLVERVIEKLARESLAKKF